MSVWLTPTLLVSLSLLSATADTCDPEHETCEWDGAAPRQQSSSTEADNPNCVGWAAAGECSANPVYMAAACAQACRGKLPEGATGAQQQQTTTAVASAASASKDADPHCPLWASKGECEKNAAFMASNCATACARRREERRDKDPQCAAWAAAGDCDTREAFMRRTCATACERALDDQLGGAECAALVAKGACSTAGGLAACRSSCLVSLHANLTSDTVGDTRARVAHLSAPPLPIGNVRSQPRC